ncbi:MAG: penicillin-binding transpeptidase domain-containing protein [bacterium]
MTEPKNIPFQESELPNESARKQFGRRFIVVKLFLALVFLIITARLVQIQIIDSADYQAKARRQYEQKVILKAVRGNIFDRSHNVLVSNSMFVSFAADPKNIEDEENYIANKFSQIFGKPRSAYLPRLNATTASGAPKRFVWLERQVPSEKAKKIQSYTLPGVVALNEPKRLYHFNEVAGTIIGFTDIDDRGISGIELQVDEYLKGKDGFIVMQRDGLGRARPSVDYPRLEPVDGNDVELTIDLGYQSIVENELLKGVQKNNADAGLAVMLNPKTGEILAMANVPGIDPNSFDKLNFNAARNRVVTDMFEPGSVFKVATASAALEHNLFPFDKRFYAERGEYIVPMSQNRTRSIKDTHEYEWLSFEEAIVVSSNIVMAKASGVIGSERLYRQARNFGFGILTGVDLPGEVRGILKRPNEWSGTTLMTLSYGYEVGVTPLQIACAYAAVANNGVLMRPYIVSAIRNRLGEEVMVQQPQKIRTVISPATAELLTRAFEGVVERGTAKDARIEGMRIAGKTGTSRKVIDGHYGSGEYTTSFVGFFPAENPQIVCLVMMDNPKSGSYYGGLTSAPVFRAIAERIINTTGHFTKTPQSQGQPTPQNGIRVPDVRTLHITIASKILEVEGLKAESIGKGEIVVRQVPEPGQRLEQGDVVQLVAKDDTERKQDGLVLIPELRGMSLRRAINRLVVENLDMKVRGSGVVVDQSPAAGQKVAPGTTVQILCEPKTSVSAVLY